MEVERHYMDEALRGFRDALKSRGHDVAVIGNPAREPARFEPLTVAAVFAVDGEPWAVDYCLLSSEMMFGPASADGETAPIPEFDASLHAPNCILEAVVIPDISASFAQHVSSAQAAADSGLADELEAAFVLQASMPGKLGGQLRIAKEAGYHTAMLIDQVPRLHKSETAHDVSPDTIADVAQKIMNDHAGSRPLTLDQVWLRSQAMIQLLVPAD